MTHDALLEAIEADPLDDAPRLVFADWLEEQGQTERATFIRWQCEASQLGEDHPRAERLLEHAEQLFAAHAATWYPGLDAWELDEIETERGFVSLISLTARQFVQLGDALSILRPMPSVFFTAMGCPMSALAHSPQLARVRALLFTDEPLLTARSATTLARSPYLGFLRELDLPANRIGANGLRALLESGRLRNVRKIGLHGNGLTNQGIAHFVLAEWPELDDLDLSNNQLTDAAAELLTASGTRRSPRRLLLYSNDLGGSGWEALAQSAWLASVEELNLNSNPIGDDGVIALARSPHLGQLRRLSLRETNLSDRGLQALVDAPWSRHLSQLNLSRNDFSKRLLDEMHRRFSRHIMKI